MKNSDRAPLLETLSHAEKDDLILRLWDDLCEARARLQALDAQTRRSAGSCRPAAPCAPSCRSTEPGRALAPAASRIGPRFGRGVLRSKFVLGVIAFIALAFALDTAVGWYQRHRLEAKRLADRSLEHAAYSGLYVDLVNVAYEPDQKSYRLTMTMRNLDPGPSALRDAHARPRVRAGGAGVAGDPGARAARRRRDRGEAYRQPSLRDRVRAQSQDVDGAHPRIHAHPLREHEPREPRAEPEDDIIDRRDRYYVYLKPHGADDVALRARMKYPGDPPVYIPMPPH